MTGKVTYTKSLLGGEKTIAKESLFIFNNKIAPQAERWFDRQSRTGGELKHCRVCSVTDFSTIIHSISDFPYEPIHKAEAIKNSVRKYEESEEWTGFIKQVKYWCTEAEKYRHKNPSESRHITTVVKEIWKAFKQEEHNFDDDTTWKIEFIEDDFEFLK